MLFHILGACQAFGKTPLILLSTRRCGARPRKLRPRPRFRLGWHWIEKTLNKIVKFQLHRRNSEHSSCPPFHRIIAHVDVFPTRFKILIFLLEFSFCFWWCRWNIVEERVGNGQFERVLLSAVHVGVGFECRKAAIHRYHFWTGVYFFYFITTFLRWVCFQFSLCRKTNEPVRCTVLFHLLSDRISRVGRGTSPCTSGRAAARRATQGSRLLLATCCTPSVLGTRITPIRCPGGLTL